MITEKGLYTLVIGALGAGLTGLGAPWSTVAVRQGYQPTITGTPSGPFLALSNQPARRFGFLGRVDAWNVDAETMDHTETQKWTQIFQVDSQWKQDPTSEAYGATPTAGDLASIASSIMQSDVTRATLLVAGVGIDRITDVRPRPFKDDSDAFEYAPFFDFCLNFDQVMTSTGNPATPRAGIYPI